MDINFERLAEIAAEAGCEAYVQEECRKVQELMNGGPLNLAVAGGSNTGKSTLINRMVVADVLEESLLADEDPRPIRLCFKRTADDERFRCAAVPNKAWAERDAVIYELHSGSLSDVSLMDSMDFVLFVVSASAPFSGTEISMLKSLAGFPRQVVLAGMNYVAEEERSKVLSYVSRINDSMGLPPVIVFENSASQDIGRIVRGLLPAYTSLERLRAGRCRTIFGRAVSAVMSALEETAKDTDLQASKAAHDAQERTRLRRAAYERLWMSAVHMQQKASEDIAMNIPSDLRTIFGGILQHGSHEGFSSEWVEGLKDDAAASISNLLEYRLSALEKIYTGNLKTITHDASFMKLSDFAFKDNAVDYSGGDAVRFDASINHGKPKFTALIGTGLIIGACALAHIPMAAKILSSAAVLAGSTVLIRKMSLSERASHIEDKLNSQIPAMSSDIEVILREASVKRYEPLVAYLREQMESMDSSEDISSTSRQHKAHLEGLLLECSRMKGEDD